MNWAQLGGVLGKAQSAALITEANMRPEAAARVLRRAKTLREALHRLVAMLIAKRAPPKADLEVLNTELAQAMTHARLEKRPGGYNWGWDETQSVALDAPLWPVSRAAAQLLTAADHTRLRECNSETCGWYFLDTTKNHSRRWCDMRGCGNRAKVRRYRGR